MFKLRAAFYLLFVFATSCVMQFDACRDLQRLKMHASRSIAPASMWYLAALHGDSESVEALGKYARQTDDPHWLDLASELNSVEALHTLAIQSVSVNQQKTLFTKSAELGHAESQFELALITEHANSKIYWLEQAADQDYQPAIVALYQWYLLHDELQKALVWLQKASVFDANSGFIFARLLWRNGEHEAAKKAFERSAEMGQRRAKSYLQHIEQFWQKDLSQTRSLTEFWVSRSHCAITIQMVALSLEGLINATTFQQGFGEDMRLQSLPICMNSPILPKPQEISCDKHWQGQKRLGCDVLQLEDLVQETEFTHLVVLAEEGKANVNNGIMYLDLADNYSVFVHELAHFAGFVDEYPLSTNLAERHCIRENAPNLLIAKGQENISLNDMSEWLSTQQPLSLSRARTCNNHSNQAYKPVNEMTFMEFYDQDHIPGVYLTLWEQALLETSKLTPAYVNFAQANEAANKPERAAFWWRLFRQFRSEDTVSDPEDAD